MRSMRNNIIYVVLLVALGIFLVTTLTRNNETLPTVDIGTVAQKARDGQVKQITVDGQDLTVVLVDDKSEGTQEEDGSVVQTLRNLGVPEAPSAMGQTVRIIVKPACG
jgi:hypothetical protein